jgi:aminoglycoside 2'-N-acetyltransferase I
MYRLHVRTTATLDPASRRALRAMLDVAYDGDFADDDWQHVLGGKHVWLEGADGIVSHGAVVPRRLVCDGRALHVGYVEAVATVATRRLQGHGTTVMRAIGDLVQAEYELGVLSTGSHAFYAALGWERWRGESWVAAPGGRGRTSDGGALGPDGHVRTPDDDDGLMVLRTPRSPRLDLAGPIVADWRAGDVW